MVPTSFLACDCCIVPVVSLRCPSIRQKAIMGDNKAKYRTEIQQVSYVGGLNTSDRCKRGLASEAQEYSRKEKLKRCSTSVCS